MEKSMLGEAGYMTDLPKSALDGMIDVVKALSRDGIRLHYESFRDRIAYARVAHQDNQDRLYLLRSRLQLRCLDKTVTF